MKNYNTILGCDSYKFSHYTLEAPGTTKTYSYVEARTGGKFDYAILFGLQYYLNEYLTMPITQEMIDEADEFAKEHGEPFNRKGWKYILEAHGGYLPLEIKAIAEGTKVPAGCVMVTVENTDINCAWLTSYVETGLLRAVWYGTTVATQSHAVKQVINGFLEKTGNPDLLPFKLVDFGSRGVSSTESCMIGGAAHLINFMSTDNILGIKFTKDYYGATGMAGFSIPASEHAVTTSWGRDGEPEFFRNILTVHAGKMVSVVCDTFDLDAAIDYWTIDLKDEVIASGCTIVIRPDSGDPVEITEHVITRMMNNVGFTLNDKGYKVLPDYFRMIQGDGITLETVIAILANFEAKGFSADNITFGSGGWLLQQVNRDTLRFAMKASWVVVNGQPRDICKDPKTDHTKASKAGRFKVIKRNDVLTTVTDDDRVFGEENFLRRVYLNGKTTNFQTFEEIKERAA